MFFSLSHVNVLLLFTLGGHGVELTKGGAQVEVAPDNVLEYVKKYAEYRMYINCSRCLQVSTVCLSILNDSCYPYTIFMIFVTTMALCKFIFVYLSCPLLK